jgi:hypothetical protein
MVRIWKWKKVTLTKVMMNKRVMMMKRMNSHLLMIRMMKKMRMLPFWSLQRSSAIKPSNTTRLRQ